MTRSADEVALLLGTSSAPRALEDEDFEQALPDPGPVERTMDPPSNAGGGY